MKGCGKDVREQGKIADLVHCVVLARETEQFEVRVRDEQVFGVPAYPVAEIETACAARDVRIDDLTDFCPASITVSAPSTGALEGVETRSPSLRNSTSAPTSMAWGTGKEPR